MISERLSNFGGLIPNKDIHHITSIISHELRTPLNAIMGFSELIQEESTNCEIKRFAKIIQDSGASLLNKIHSIIDYNILDLCNDIFIEEIDLKQFVYSLWDDFKDQIKDHNEVQFEVDYPGEVDDLTLFSDSKKIRYIISQLLSNSIKFTQSGKIIIGVKRTFEQDSCNDSVQIFVSDTGAGIPIDMGSIVYSPYHKVNESLNSQFEGLGLGLAICKKLSNLISAKLCLESSYKQTVFNLSLPVVSVVNNPEYNYCDNNTISKKSILIIDKEPDEVSEYPLPINRNYFKVYRISHVEILKNIYKSYMFADCVLLKSSCYNFNEIPFIVDLARVWNKSLIITETGNSVQNKSIEYDQNNLLFIETLNNEISINDILINKKRKINI
jgi:hypothetical protein